MRVTKYLPLYPWLGGLNTSTDPMILDAQKLVQSDNIIFTTQGSRKKRGGQARYNSSAATTANFVYLADYWATVSSTQSEYFVAVDDSGKFWRSPFNTTWSSFSTQTLSVSQGGITSMVIQNDLVVGLRGNTLPLKWVGQNTSTNMVSIAPTSAALPFTKAWILMSFLERGWFAGDPGNPDKIYISKTGDYQNFTTGGAGFATVLEVGVGDGDPSGITAMFPSTAGDRVVYVCKRRKMYRIDCTDLDQAEWKITRISDTIGCVGPSTVAVIDMADVMFASDRGVHTVNQIISATAIIEGQFLSFPIQYDWLNEIAGSGRTGMSATYVPAINSYLIGCKRVGKSTYETIYGFNIELKEWFRWTSVPCNHLMLRFNPSSGADELYAADNSGFVNKLLQTALSDFGNAITTRIKTAFIAPAGIPFQENQFTNLACVYRAHENSTFTVAYSVDGLSSQNVIFQQRSAGGNILGTTLLGLAFILGNIQAIKPVWNHLAIEEGNSIQLTFTQNGLNQDFELFGIILEYIADEEGQNAFRNPVYGS